MGMSDVTTLCSENLPFKCICIFRKKLLNKIEFVRNNTTKEGDTTCVFQYCFIYYYI